MDSESVFRLGCHSGKYLWANEDGSSVKQEQNGLSQNAHWTVEPLSKNALRLRSCYGKYLTASGEPFENSLTEFKVIQTNRNDRTVAWEMIESSPNKVMLKPVCCQIQYLTSNNSSNPQRNNSVTHMELGSGNVWWEFEFVKKTPKAHPGVQDLTASQSYPAQTSRSFDPIQAQGSNISTLLSGASSAANLAFTGYKLSKELFHQQEQPIAPNAEPIAPNAEPIAATAEPIAPIPDESSNSVLDSIGEFVFGFFG